MNVTYNKKPAIVRRNGQVLLVDVGANTFQFIAIDIDGNELGATEQIKVRSVSTETVTEVQATFTATPLQKLATPTIELDGDDLVLTSVDSRAQHMKIYRNGVLYDTVLTSTYKLTEPGLYKIVLVAEGYADSDESNTVTYAPQGAITKDYVDCTESNTATQVAVGDSYTNRLTPDTGKVLGSGTVTVVMNGEIVQPTYNADGSATISIDYVTGGISIVAHATAKTYSHTLSLVGCTASFTDSTIDWGDLYVNTLSAEAGRALIEGTVEVTMGGVALTPTYNQDGTVSISTTVTGAIVVTAEAVIKRTVLVSAQDCTYTNTSSDLFDGERYANVFTPDSGFIFSTGTVSCTMGGVAVAPQYNADGTVTIDVEVNGDIVISATPTLAVNEGFIKIGAYDAILYLGGEAVDRVYKRQVLIYGNTP